MRAESLFALNILSSLKQSGSIESFEVSLEESKATKIEVKDQKIDALTRTHDVGISVRVLKNHRSGFSFTTSLEKPAIEKAIHSAVAISRAMPEDPHCHFAKFSQHAYRAAAPLDWEGLRKPIEDKIKTALELERRVRAFDRRITGLRSASITEGHSFRELTDSEGQSIQREGLTYSAGVACKAEQNGESQMGWSSEFSKRWDALNIDLVVTDAGESAVELLGAGSAPTGTFPAVFRNSVVSELIDFLSDSFSAENISKGRSLLIGKQNQKIVSDRITLLDDALAPGGYYDSPFDAEGTPTETTTLLAEGVVRDCLSDLYHARKLKLRPTGSAQRSIKGPPSIGTRNLILKPGSKSYQALIGDAYNGILITHLMGLHTANSITGDFSLGASGILIKNGKLDHPVKGFAIAGNILTLLSQVQAIGSDFRYFGATGCSSLLISGLAVGGK